jgi:predicted DNA-binding protein (UPF0251 family)/predicted Fe-Mo cluster-binding NifX family protein
MEEQLLTLDGFEALRLVDLAGLRQEAAAAQMKISRQTFGRILADARRTVAGALVNGMALRIQLGDENQIDHNQFNIVDRTKNLDTATAATRTAKEPQMDKIAISCEGPSLEDRVDPRFGRAAGFLIVDPETMQTEYVDNGSSQAMAQGAGIQAAETVAATGARIVLTGFVGPKAFMALQAAGIQVGQDLENLTAQEAVERYRKNQVSVASGPNREGHWK